MIGQGRHIQEALLVPQVSAMISVSVSFMSMSMRMHRLDA